VQLRQTLKNFDRTHDLAPIEPLLLQAIPGDGGMGGVFHRERHQFTVAIGILDNQGPSRGSQDRMPLFGPNNKPTAD